jgi:hypothetical protein
MVTRKTPAVRIACSAAFLVLALALVPVALAGKPAAGGGGGGGKKGGGGTTGGGTIGLVLLNSTDGVAHYGQGVTFNVSTTFTYPWVQLTCSQNGTSVFGQYIGFYAGYPWSQVFTLSSYLWPGGAADCTARLYDSSTNATLATTSFHVYA